MFGIGEYVTWLDSDDKPHEGVVWSRKNGKTTEVYDLRFKMVLTVQTAILRGV